MFEYLIIALTVYCTGMTIFTKPFDFGLFSGWCCSMCLAFLLLLK